MAEARVAWKLNGKCVPDVVKNKVYCSSLGFVRRYVNMAVVK